MKDLRLPANGLYRNELDLDATIASNWTQKKSITAWCQEPTDNSLDKTHKILSL